MANASKSAQTTNKILKSIKMRCLIPESQITFSDTDLIDFMNEEMLIGLVPVILQMKDNYLIYSEQVPMENGKMNYSIPERALGSKLNEVSYWDGTNEFEMTQVNLDEKYIGIGLSRQFGFMRQFYVKGSDIIPYPEIKPSDTVVGSLVMYYYMRPNALVKDSEVGIISAIDRVNGTITLNSVPSAFTVDSQYDFIRIRSPHTIIKIDVSITDVNKSTKTITLANASDIPKDLIVGDSFSMAGESCVPNVPTELHSVLAQRVACRLLEAMGDTANLQNANAKLQEMEQKMGILLDSRVESAVHKIVNRGVLRNIRGRFSRGIF
jgi:hypothetical protein